MIEHSIDYKGVTYTPTTDQIKLAWYTVTGYEVESIDYLIDNLNKLSNSDNRQVIHLACQYSVKHTI